ncbi:MAG: universal stress protein [Silvanigrellaceae bacterium]
MTILRGKRILCATDLSHPTLQTERKALSLARAFDAKVTFLHVLEDAPLFLGPMPFEEGQKWEQLETRYRGELLAQTLQRAENTLSTLRDEHEQFQIQVKLGNAENEIINLLEQDQGHFGGVIIGRHHHSKLYSTIFGTVAQRILEQSPVPVVVLPMNEDSQPFELKNIGLATTMRPDSHTSETILRELLEADPGKKRSAHLAFCFERVSPGYSGFETTDAYTTYRELEMIYDLAESRLQRAIEERARILQEDGFNATGHLLIGKTEDELKQFIIDNKLDILIFGRHAKEGSHRFKTGRVVSRFVRNTPCIAIVG